MSRVWVTAMLSAAAFACSSPVERTLRIERIAPAADPTCGAPADARSMVIRALGRFAASETSAVLVELGGDEDFSIDRFPPATEALAVEVLGFGGALRSVGRSLPFELDRLRDDATIPVFMAPREEMCPAGPPVYAREQALVARAGDAGALVAGGRDDERAPVLGVEWYDTRSGTFVDLGTALYGSEAQGLAGASMTELPEQRIVILGGASTAFQVFDAETLQFTTPAFLREARAFHAAVALGPEQLFTAGGCAEVVDGACVLESALRTSSTVELDTGTVRGGPSLQAERIGGTAILEPGGTVLLVGGVDSEGNPRLDAERLQLDTGDTELLAASSGVAANTLASSAIIGFAGAGQPARGDWSVVPANAPASALTASMGYSDASLVPLETGEQLLLAREGQAMIDGSEGRLRALDVPELGERTGHSAVRLGDGSVLILGGRSADDGVDGRAFVLRPDLAGPLSSGASATFADSQSAIALVARDPSRCMRANDDGPHLAIALAGGIEEWMLLAGPVFDEVTVEVALATDADQVFAILGWLDAGSHYRVELGEGRDARLVHVQGTRRDVLGECSQSPVPAGGLSPRASGQLTHELTVTVRVDTVTAVLDGAEVLSCIVDEGPVRGAVGLGAVAEEDRTLRVDLLTATR